MKHRESTFDDCDCWNCGAHQEREAEMRRELERVRAENTQLASLLMSGEAVRDKVMLELAIELARSWEKEKE